MTERRSLRARRRGTSSHTNSLIRQAKKEPRNACAGQAAQLQRSECAAPERRRARAPGRGTGCWSSIAPNSFLEIETFAGLRQMGLFKRLDCLGANVEDGVVLGALIARRRGLRDEPALTESLHDQVDLRAMRADATRETARGRRLAALVLGQNEHDESKVLVAGDAGVAGKSRAHYGARQQVDGSARLQGPSRGTGCGRF